MNAQDVLKTVGSLNATRAECEQLRAQVTHLRAVLKSIGDQDSYVSYAGDDHAYLTALSLSAHAALVEYPAAPVDINTEMLTVLEMSAATFRRYEKLHRSKGTGDGDLKAVANASAAEKCEAAIAKAKAAGGGS